MSAQNLKRPSSFQVSKPEGVAVPLPPPPPPQTQEWKSFTSVASAHGRQTSSQHIPAAPASHAPLPHPPANELTIETNSVRIARSTRDAYNAAEAQSHHPEVTTNSRVVTPTDRAPTLPAPPTDPTQSILLEEEEEKGKALYSMRGLAASIKRSLNAERLAASTEPSASSNPPSQNWKPLNSIEAAGTQHQTKSSSPGLAIGKSSGEGLDSKAGTQPVNLITEPVDSPATLLPVSVSEVSIPHEETIRTANDFQTSNSKRDSSPIFTPYSSLTGAVSFDNITDSVPVNHNPAPSSEATGILEDTTTSQPTSQIVLHDHVEDSIILDQPSFEALSFPHRTPTPPLAATITTVYDEDEVDENAIPTPSSRPSIPLHEIEIGSQLEYISSGNDDIEMSSIPGEDQVPTKPNIASSEFFQAWDNHTLMQEAEVPTHQATSLDRPIEEIDRGPIGSPSVEEHPGNVRRHSAQVPGEPPKTSPIRVQGTDSAETSIRGSLPTPSMKFRGKQRFYIAVPPASEWVRQAKRREAERKALMKEKAGEFGYLGITSCYF